MMNICLPGTGGMVPLKNRWLTCCLIEYLGNALLIDCGEGTQIALHLSGRKISHIRTLLITHTHADHIAGLPGFLLTLGNTGKTSPLLIAGPKGIRKTVQALLTIAPFLPYPLEVQELEPQDILQRDGMEIRCLALMHSVPCLGYRVTVYRKPVFSPQKAEALQIPRPFYRQLHEGNTVCLPDHRMIAPEQVIEKERPPLSVCYCTDTLPIPAIARFAEGADLMICEGMYGEDDMLDKMEKKGHMLFSDAAALAAQAGVGRLWLTHYSPAMQN
ncbi:MAG TPA: ribonuclease Z, partial [Firmicutes bacterium]|nr:ribonuclease Z [Bacillota bacterium]